MTIKPRLAVLAAALGLVAGGVAAVPAQADHTLHHTVTGDCMFDIRWLDDWAECRLQPLIAPRTAST